MTKQVNTPIVRGDPANTRESAMRDAILNIAAELFFEHGYDVVSVDSIVAKVGGSKTNIYRHFGGKEGLLTALVERESEALRKPLDKLDLTSMNIESALNIIGMVFLDIVYDKRAIALHRLVIAQGKRFPILARCFVAAGPEGSTKAVSEIIRSWQSNGAIAKDRRSDVLARQFLELVKLNTHNELLFGLGPRPSVAKRKSEVSEAVVTFLRGVAC